ncbi:MAG: glycerophosphodiester phosphodiesterase family protein [Pseudomonadota bacterium]
MYRITAVVALLSIAIWAWNSSRLVGAPEDGETKLLSHRGVHQQFSYDGLTNDTCTAERMLEPTHAYLENTLPSILEAFEAGADIVEIDVHPTTDGHWAVFHDWTLDCRTVGRGRTRDASRAELKTLDVGYGYTADDGETFPFRGIYVGGMPMLDEVFDAFPNQRFLLNFKSSEAEEGTAFAAYLRAHSKWQDNIFGVYGGGANPVDAFRAEFPDIRGYSRPSMKACLLDYGLWGWTGRVPMSCRDTYLIIPVSHAKWLWGWPHKLTQRLERVGTEVILLGPHKATNIGSRGIDGEEELAGVPDGFDGYIWTNRIEVIGPLLKEAD